MTETELKEHLEAAEKSPREIAAAVSRLPPEVLRFQPAPEKWSILHILGHLADVEILYGYRMRQMLADVKPVIAPIDQNAWAKNLNYLQSPAPELVAFYSLARHHNLRLLQSLKPSDLAKSAFHPETQKEVSVADLVGMMSGHGASHLKQIENLKAAAQMPGSQPKI
ncbi:MAG: DinB family protein [Acidobacteriales bacterium]|nr:DinB family protein [Terriglobales bacterium]